MMMFGDVDEDEVDEEDDDHHPLPSHPFNLLMIYEQCRVCHFPSSEILVIFILISPFVSTLYSGHDLAIL